MTRAQCIVHRGNRILMELNRDLGSTWWCLPGGGVEMEEGFAAAALRELREECTVEGRIVRELARYIDPSGGETITYLVDIGEQDPELGSDPECDPEVIVRLSWLTLDQIPERDRAFLWAAGLLSIKPFRNEVLRWGDAISYPPET
jgi:8-oxo-dGTP pyrophosphatase MutT (NUDIX family)